MASCIACGAAIPTGGKFCPACGQSVSTGGTWDALVKPVSWRWVFLFAAALLLFMYWPSSRPTPQQLAERPIDIDAGALVSAFQTNEVSAKARFVDHRARVAGMVGRVGVDVRGSPYVALVGKEGELGANAYFDNGNGDATATLAPGQPISVTCTVSGEVLGSIVLNACSL